MKEGSHEHELFKEFAKADGLNMDMHPLHLLYLNSKTSDALKAFQAGYKAAKEITERQLTVDYEYPSHIFYEIIRKSSYAFYLFQWVPYQTDARQWRLKMRHDVKTFDGREEFNIWPNSTYCGSFKDEEVEFIRISRNQHGDDYVDPRDKPKQEETLELGLLPLLITAHD